MKITTYFRIAIMTGVLFALVACSKEETGDNGPFPGDGEEINVAFNYSVEALVSGDGQTETRLAPGDLAAVDGAGIPVKNMWILQFDGTSASSKMLGAPRFISESALAVSPLTVPLIQNSGNCYTVFVANMMNTAGEYNWNLSTESTFADAAKRIKSITEEADTYETIGSDKTLILSAVVNSPVLPATTLSPEFKRSVAKVTLNLTLSNPATMEITSVRLRNVSTSITYADVIYKELGVGVAATDVFPENIATMDYDAVTTGLPINNGSQESFSWYVPRNQRGISPASLPSFKNKTFFAPADATYFEIVAKKTVGTEVTTSIFRVYPGADQEKDYNLISNHHYQINLKVTDINDSRVENFGNRDFTDIGKTSNSFILNPAPEGGSTRTYRIPIDQVNRYWGKSFEGYGNEINNTINSAADQWQVELLWCDLDNLFSTTPSTTQICLVNSGIGAGPGYFELSVPPAQKLGNFVLGIRKTSGSGTDILWSWHFWVTNYNPDGFNRSVITSGVYTYQVPNGQVERYADPDGGGLWGGDYADRVMMDRALGIIDGEIFTSVSEYKQGLLNYQFGRKDPFPLSNLSLNSTVSILIAGQNSISQSVYRPNIVFAVSGNWASDAGTSSFIWNDPQATDQLKSIYDPCPPGWQLPVSGVWSDFSRQIDGKYVTTLNDQRDLGWAYGRGIGSSNNEVNGLRYWPGTTLDASVGGRIWYPFLAARGGDSGNPQYWQTGYWTSTASGTNTGYSLNFGNDNVDPINNWRERSASFSVRCISSPL